MVPLINLTCVPFSPFKFRGPYSFLVVGRLVKPRDFDSIGSEWKIFSAMEEIGFFTSSFRDPLSLVGTPWVRVAP